MTVREWLITIIVLAIPIVNVVLYLYWSFASSGNLNRRNYCRASLIIFVIVVGIAVVFASLGGLAAIISSGQSY